MLRTHVRAGLGREVGESALTDLRNLYRGANYQVDESVGRLLDALDRQIGRASSRERVFRAV